MKLFYAFREDHKLHSRGVFAMLFVLFILIAFESVYGYRQPVFAPETLDTTQWEVAPSPWPVGYAVLTAEQVEYTTDTEQIVCTWANFGNEPISYGEPFTLQKKVNGKWLVAQRSDGIILRFLLPAYPLGSNESKTHCYDVAFMLDDLTPGEYRIAADYSVESKSGNSNDWQSRVRQSYGYFVVIE